MATATTLKLSRPLKAHINTNLSFLVGALTISCSTVMMRYRTG